MTSQINGTQLWMLSPEIAIILLALVVLLLDLVIRRRALVAAVAIGGLIVPVAATTSLAFQWFGPLPANRTAFWGTLVVDSYAIFFQYLFLIIAAMVGLVAYNYSTRYLRATVGEFYAILLMSVTGMMLMAGTRELISIYISLELTSIPLYILAGIARAEDKSAEAAIKYVLLGAMSSAILLYGMALLYGATGSTDLGEVAAAATHGLQSGNLLLLVADVFIFAGFGFKISAVPFHMWAPDIYEGAPTPSTLFFSVGSKAAGFAALLRVFVVGGLVATSSVYLWILVAVVAALTMTVGNVVALLQTNIKRMMAYSSIAQAGYLLVGLAALMIHDTVIGNVGILLFLFIYVITNLGVFAGIIALADISGRETIRDFDGFGRRSPWIAVGMSVCLLSLAGMPPMGGFFGKLFIFIAAWSQGGALTWLVILGLINSAISMVYYLNVVWRMFSVEPAKVDRPSTPRGVSIGMGVAVAGVIASLIVLGPLLYQISLGAGSLFAAHP
ncbi:MAG TPA: NADH-quinone oxidoreductase subunit N [Ktedonobacterales bacterium]|jgi:NADH-quinone oxidoreductase subunit N